MNHSTSRYLRLGAIFLVLGACRISSGQVYPPPPPGQAVPDLREPALEMADQVVNLAEAMLHDMGDTPEGLHLIEDARELSLAVREFRESAARGGGRDAYRLRQSYAGIDQSWNHLRTMLVRHGSTLAVNRAARRVDAAHEQLRQAVGLQTPPQDIYGGIRPAFEGGGLDEARQSVRSLRQRAETLVAAMRSDLGDHPNRQHILQDASQLVDRAGAFEQFLGQNPSHEHMRTAYASINDVANCLHNDLSQAPPPRQVVQVWQSFAQMQQTVHQSLDMPFPPPLTELDGPEFLPQQAPAPVGLVNDARAAARSMRQRAETLVAAMRSDLGDHPNRQHILQDASYLVERSGTFEQFLDQRPSPERIRTAYASINDVANCLHNDLSQAPPPEPVLQSWRSFTQIQSTVHQSLGLPVPPPPTELIAAAPPEIGEARRVAAAMQQRAEVLLASMQRDLGGGYPNRAHVVEDATHIYHRAEAFEQFLAGNPPPDQIARAYAPLQEVATCLHGDLTREPPPREVLQSWESFVQTQQLIPQGLNLAAPPLRNRVALRPPIIDDPGPLPGLADQLVGQVEAFLGGFAPTVNQVPEGERFLGDAQRLHQAALGFQQASYQGQDPGQLAYQFREVEVHWNRLARRIDRIAQGRVGPNIQTAMGIGAICQQIHQVLAMPGQDPRVFPGDLYRR